MPSQAGVEIYNSQNVPSAYPRFSQAIERYNDQDIWFAGQKTSYAYQQMMRTPREVNLLSTNFDKVYEQQRPVKDFAQQLQTLHRYYTIMDNDRTIIDLLQEEPELYPLLLDAVKPLQQAFGDKRLVYIRVQTSDEDSILKVAVWLPADFGNDPERTLQAFDEDWWLKNCHRSAGALVFDYEMQNAV